MIMVETAHKLSLITFAVPKRHFVSLAITLGNPSPGGMTKSACSIQTIPDAMQIMDDPNNRQRIITTSE
jgi:hypothetical protein